MKGERVIIAGPYPEGRQAAHQMVDNLTSQDEHTVLAEVALPMDVVNSADPRRQDVATTAIVFDYPSVAQTVTMIASLRMVYPDIKVVTWGVDEPINEDGYALEMNATRDDLKEMLLSVEHQTS